MSAEGMENPPVRFLQAQRPAVFYTDADEIRLVCRGSRQSNATKTSPSLTRSELLREFTRLYKWTFQRAVHSALRVQGGMANFDYSGMVMSVDLRYRTDCDGNPGIAFSVENAAFRPRAEINPNAAFVLDMARSLLFSKQMKLRLAHGDKFVGLMNVLYTTEDDFVFGHQEIYHHAPWFEESVAKLRHDTWLPELQRTIQEEFIFRPQDDSGTARLGRMKKDKSKWSWAPLTEEEVVAMGLPTMSARGLPGEGFALLL